MKAPHSSKQHILVIDDNRAIHEDFRKIFGGNEGVESLDAAEANLFGDAPEAAKKTTFRIDFAYQGQEGLAMVQKAQAEGDPYAMAFVDVRMPPGWDGIETIARIWEVYPDLQVVVCTAYSDYLWDDMNAKLGHSDRLVILKKPFDNVEVMQLAGALTEKWNLLQQTRQHTLDLEATIEKRTAELRASEQRFRLLNDCSPVGVFETDATGACSHANPRCLSIIGLTLAQCLGSGWAERLHPEDAAGVVEDWKKVVAAAGKFNREYRFQWPDGRVRWVHGHTSPILEKNIVVGHVGTLTDITERKNAEAERKQMELQIQQGQKLESIGRLAAGVAHEINTPTQYIGDNTQFVRDSFTELLPVLSAPRQLLDAFRDNRITAELLLATEETLKKADVDYLIEEIPKAVAQSLEGVERVTKIVRAMKEFSHPGTEDKTQVDLNHAIDSTLTVARSEWKYVADLVTDFDGTLPPVICLAGEFNQVILNLTVNAAHAIADTVKEGDTAKGIITVTTKRDGDWAEVRIRDSGTGIPEHARRKIFDPFFTTKGVGKGTGQGLAIAHSVIVDKHGGNIRFETEMGKGTVFIIRIPISPIENIEPQNKSEEKEVCV